jgi:hypothetical protein
VSSSFSSFIPQYPQENFLDQLAALEQSIMQQNQGMMQQVYNQFGGVTDNVVNQSLSNAGQAAGQATQDFGTYNANFPQTMGSLLTEAKDFASTPRIQAEMGRAGATATQAGDTQRAAAMRDLEDQGIDTSSGKYAQLDAAQRAATAASAAGAQNAARVNTEQVGRALRSEGLQNLARLPGQGIAELSTANAGAANAENAAASRAAAAGNLLGTPQTWASLAGSLKYPPLGNSGSSVQSPKSNSNNNSRNSTGDNAGAGPAGSGNSGIESSSAADPNWAGMSAAGNSGGSGGRGYSQPGPGIVQGSGGTGGPAGDQFPDERAILSGGEEGGTAGGILPPDGSGFNPGEAAQQGADTGGLGGSDFTGGNANASDWASAPDMSNTFDFGGDGGDFAEGGDVGDGGDDSGEGALPAMADNDATTGGFLPRSLSPSGGRQTDDIRASLNAEEFVVPRDVARWKGEEYFQKLIDQSRKARMAAKAQPQMKRPAPGPVRFRSMNLGGAI